MQLLVHLSLCGALQKIQNALSLHLKTNRFLSIPSKMSTCIDRLKVGEKHNTIAEEKNSKIIKHKHS